jgi:ATP-grasp domain-containing protein
MPRPTAHPTTAAWPVNTPSSNPDSSSLRPCCSPREQHVSAAFGQLQHRLLNADPGGQERGVGRAIVVVPSRSVDRWHEPAAESQAYGERQLSMLLELNDPNVRITYVTSVPIAPAIVDYYLSLLPTRLRRTARNRLTLIALGERSTRPLSQKLLERPSVVNRIRRTIPARWPSYLVSYAVTALERDLALALEIPIFGADPRHARWGTKSGSRELFAMVGIPTPRGFEHLASGSDAVDAVARLREMDPSLKKLVLKLNQGVSGEGNAIIDLAGLPAPGSASERACIARRLSTVAPDGGVVSTEAYLAKLAARGGIVEEHIEGQELRSPSVQLEIAPDGQVELISTHDQILGGPGGQHYLGCRFPAEPSYAPTISSLARRVAQRLADIGVIGRFSVDFVVARERNGDWAPYAVELNLRSGGTNHPYQALARLAGGTYDERSATFTAGDGDPRYYVATDYLQTPQLSVLGRDGVLALAAREDLRFDRRRRVGPVFHMLCSIDKLGRAGFTAIGRSAAEANAIFDHVHATLALRSPRNAAGICDTERYRIAETCFGATDAQDLATHPAGSGRPCPATPRDRPSRR